MTKRDIIKFLEKKQTEKIFAIRDEYEARRDKLIQKTYSKLGLPALADKIQPLLAEACALWEAWKKKHENAEGLSFHAYYNSLATLLANSTASEDATYLKLKGDHLTLETKEMEFLRKMLTDELDGANSTYTTVIATVQQMKAAKEAAAYLKELGFDLSELENPAEQVQTALMVPVDTRHLFVKAA
jgi:hypothetical protein